MVDHDRLFKELLTTFFLDFLALFAPELSREVEPASVEFLEKELYTDVVAGDRHEVDLLVGPLLRYHPARPSYVEVVVVVPLEQRFPPGLAARHDRPPLE